MSTAPPGALLNLLSYTVVESPLGPLTIFASGERLLGVEFGDDRACFEDKWVRRRLHGVVTEHPDPAGAVTALRAYFAGDLHALDRLSVDPIGTTFQRRVWTALRTVKAGLTVSYADIARRSARPRRPAPSVPPMARTRSLSSCRVIGSSALEDRSSVMAAASSASAGCSSMRVCC